MIRSTAAVLFFASCLPALAAAPAVSPHERKAAQTITPEEIRAHIRFLSADELEGRGPATRGDAIAEKYIAAQMEGMGLEPGAPDGGWFQRFDVIGIASHVPKTLELKHGGDSVELKFLEDFIAASGVQAPEAKIDDAEIVFVGYGIVAPEYRWDDFKGADLKGKVLLIMNNDPDHTASGDPKLFEGNQRLYYGRWMYKYEMAAKQGAAGAIIIHTQPSAAYKWQVVQSSWTGEQFELPAEGEPTVQVKAWTTEDASRKLAKLGGFDLDQLRASAESRDFKPVPLGVKLSLKLQNDVSRKQTGNVIGKLAGHDPALRNEAVFYTAHHDHLGIKQDARPGEDKIYNGALDNASGVATLLAIARAAAADTHPHRRAIYFAAVAGEEQGLLGSKYLALHPPVPAGRIAADINMDSENIWGRTRDLVQIGQGKSTLDGLIEKLARAQGRHVVGDQFPDKGTYYRSDQFSFAHVGVPGAYFKAGSDAIGRPSGWSRQQQQAFEDAHYHQPSDELGDDWNFDGAVEDAQLMLWLGQKIADDPKLPAWKPGDEFEAARKKALAEAAAR